MHVDQHALAFLPGSSSILLIGNDGGAHGTTNADIETRRRIPPGLTWTLILTQSSFTLETSAATLPVLLPQRRAADRRTTARSRLLLPGRQLALCYGSWGWAVMDSTRASIP